jgi:hypothetical protein
LSDKCGTVWEGGKRQAKCNDSQVVGGLEICFQKLDTIIFSTADAKVTYDRQFVGTITM